SRIDRIRFAADHSAELARTAKAILARTNEAHQALTFDYSLTRRALGLAVGSLLLAGSLSVLLVIGRVPGLPQPVTEPQFFKRCLVLHVDLALIVWFFASASALFSLLPGDRASHRTYRNGFAVACAGVLTMIAGTMIPHTAPVLANYVPVIDNPLYIT